MPSLTFILFGVTVWAFVGFSQNSYAFNNDNVKVKLEDAGQCLSEDASCAG